MLEDLIRNPEDYRIGENYRASNIVFPVKFKDKKYILKKSRTSFPLINLYYIFQDKFFYGSRRLKWVSKIFETEAKKLAKLNGVGAPKIYSFREGIMVREYIDGEDFRNLSSDNERQKTLEGAFDALEQIHAKHISIGDAHIKNTVNSEKGVYWVGLSGSYDESDPIRAKAIDILKYVYSTYTATRNEDLTLHAAQVASKYYDGIVQADIRNLITPGLISARLWFPTRLPLNGKLNRDIKKILKS